MSAADQPFVKQRAPTLYGIIIFKLVKGALFVTLAITAYALSDNNLPEEFQKLMHFLQVHPANKFFDHLAASVGKLTENDLLWTALGTLIYSSFSLVEGVGLIFRQGWAAWLAIGESAFFIPIEVYELSRTDHFSWGLVAILIVNILIVWYLLVNRNRIFRHHHPHAATRDGPPDI
ncbi:MAG: DUF2127 domain-containing protein [Verrucomicrobia bacterium]|nr:DUF2127 domain-containing protein [Verrucomicrobiota bacterium]